MRHKWELILAFIKMEGRPIHKIYSSHEGYCFLTDINGKRYHITEANTFSEVQSIINQIKQINQNGRITTNREADAPL